MQLLLFIIHISKTLQTVTKPRKLGLIQPIKTAKCPSNNIEKDTSQSFYKLQETFLVTEHAEKHLPQSEFIGSFSSGPKLKLRQLHSWGLRASLICSLGEQRPPTLLCKRAEHHQPFLFKSTAQACSSVADEKTTETAATLGILWRLCFCAMNLTK